MIFIGKSGVFGERAVGERKRRDASENEVYLTTSGNESLLPHPPMARYRFHL
jgi:hypothetical protein